MTDLRMRPSREEFHALAAEHTVVPVWTELLADLETPVAAYVKLVGDGSGFLLESVEHGERWARYSFVGRDPVATLVLRDGHITVDGPVPDSVPRDRGMLAALEVLLQEYRSPRDAGPAAAAGRGDGLPRLRRGARGRASARRADRRPGSARRG